MSLEYTFDPKRPLYVVTGHGEVTSGELLSIQAKLIEHEQIPPRCPGILDFRYVTRLDVSAETVQNMVKRGNVVVDRVGPSRIAVVTATESAYGLMRMYEILSEDGPHTVSVFHDIDEAERWVMEG